MDLKTFALKQDDTVSGKLSRDSAEIARIADECNVTPGFLYLVALGHKPASSELACNIEYATKGWVNRRVTLPAFPWDRPVDTDISSAA